MGVIKIKNNNGDWVKLPNYNITESSAPDIDLSDYYTRGETDAAILAQIEVLRAEINVKLDLINGEVV